MKMELMNKFFEDRGFEVSRFYNGGTSTYTFTISKNGREIMADFKYPGTLDAAGRDRIQREFLHSTLNAFHIAHGPFDGVSVSREELRDLINYCEKDFEATKSICHATRDALTIKDVIFHNPATIVFWMDDTKTVVKCQDEDEYDPEKGLAMAIAKKALGNKGNYCNEMKKWLGKCGVPLIYPTLPDPFNLSKAVVDFGAFLDERIEALRNRKSND